MKKRHLVLGALSSLAILTYIDRLCISVAGPRMQEDLSLSPEQWGWVVGIFAISYGAFEIPVGAMGDASGQRRVLARIVGWWSVFTSLTGTVSNFFVLLLVRFLFGVGEAGAFPNISGCVSRWFPATERGRAQGIVWGSSRLGGIFTPLIVVPIMTAFGWRATFWTFGVVGVLWVLVWLRWYHDQPAQHPGITRQELEEIGVGSQAAAHTGLPWRKLFRARQLWMIMLMYSFYGWGSYFYLSWLHTYLVKGRGLTEQEMGIFSTLPFILGAGANIIGGLLSDSLSRKYGLKTGRRVMGSISLVVGSLFVFATAMTTGKMTGVILISLGYGAMDLMLPSAWAVCLDIGGKYAGAVTGAMNSSGHIGGFSSSVLFGYLVQHFGSYNAPLFAIGAMLMISAVIFSRIDPTRPLVPEEAEVAQCA